MGRSDSLFYDVGTMDTLSRQETAIHRLDPRAKVLTTLVFIIVIVSFGKYDISALLPFFVYPIALMAQGNLPVLYFVRRILIVAPFALLIGIFNPFMDREILLHLGPMGISGGWVSFASILLRFVLTVGSALILVASTGFNPLCMALDRMGAPRVFSIQLLFLYRYLFVLGDEASRMVRARSLRSFMGQGMGIRVFASMAGQLLLRTLNRAQRIHLAMLSRGFDGEIRLSRTWRIRSRDVAFVIGWCALFAGMRLYNVPHVLGNLMRGLTQ